MESNVFICELDMKDSYLLNGKSMTGSLTTTVNLMFKLKDNVWHLFTISLCSWSSPGWSRTRRAQLWRFWGEQQAWSICLLKSPVWKLEKTTLYKDNMVPDTLTADCVIARKMQDTFQALTQLFYPNQITKRPCAIRLSDWNPLSMIAMRKIWV